jgi:hypothetical protein
LFFFCQLLFVPCSLPHDPTDKARLEQEKTQLSRQIAATDAAIDKRVYELYGLTEEEIAIVEGNKPS